MVSTCKATGGAPRPPQKGLYKRFFAWLLSRMQRHYGEEIDRRKRAMLAGLEGTVVEIGVGAGANLPLYPETVELIVVEPNAHMHPYLETAARRHGVRFEVRDGDAARMDVGDSVADYVVSTLVMCSVADQQEALREVLRVLKPGGEFLFLEHVAAPRGSAVRRTQERLRGLWRVIGDGCTLDRETWAAIESAGFATCDVEHFEADTFSFARPHIAGRATKR